MLSFLGTVTLARTKITSIIWYLFSPRCPRTHTVMPCNLSVLVMIFLPPPPPPPNRKPWTRIYSRLFRVGNLVYDGSSANISHQHHEEGHRSSAGEGCVRVAWNIAKRGARLLTAKRSLQGCTSLEVWVAMNFLLCVHVERQTLCSMH